MRPLTRTRRMVKSADGFAAEGRRRAARLHGLAGWRRRRSGARCRRRGGRCRARRRAGDHDAAVAAHASFLTFVFFEPRLHGVIRPARHAHVGIAETLANAGFRIRRAGNAERDELCAERLGIRLFVGGRAKLRDGLGRNFVTRTQSVRRFSSLDRIGALKPSFELGRRFGMPASHDRSNRHDAQDHPDKSFRHGPRRYHPSICHRSTKGYGRFGGV